MTRVLVMAHASVSLAKLNCHRLSGLNNRHSFLTILEMGKSKIKALANSVPSEGLLPCRDGHVLIETSYEGERYHTFHVSFYND